MPAQIIRTPRGTDVAKKNYIPYPSMELSYGDYNVNNRATNPTVITTTGYSGGVGSGGAASGSRLANAGAVSGSAYRWAWTASTSGGGGSVKYQTADTVPTGRRLFSAWVRSSKAQPLQLTVTGTFTGTLVAGSNPIVTVSANTWTRLTAVYDITVPGTTQLSCGVAGTYAPWLAGDTLDISNVLIKAGSAALTAFSGDDTSSGPYVYAWSGAAGASISSRVARGIAGWTPWGDCVVEWTSFAGMSRLHCGRLYWEDGGHGAYVECNGPVVVGQDDLQPGQVYTFQLDVYSPVGGPDYYVEAGGPGTVPVSGAPVTTKGAWANAAVTFTTSSAGTVALRLRAVGDPAPGQYLYFDRASVTDGPTAGAKFTGANQPDDTYSYAWTGTADASSSVALVPAAATLMHPRTILGWESDRIGRNRVHDVLGTNKSPVGLRPASLRTGRMQLMFPDEASATSAEGVHGGAGTFELDYPEFPALSMTYVISEGGKINLRLDVDTERWVLTVDFQEIDA